MSIVQLLKASQLDHVFIEMNNIESKGYVLKTGDKPDDTVTLQLEKQSRYPQGIHFYSVQKTPTTDLPLQIALNFLQQTYYCYCIRSAVNLFATDIFEQPVKIFDPPIQLKIAFNREDLAIAQLSDDDLEQRKEIESEIAPSVERLRDLRTHAHGPLGTSPSSALLERLCVLVGANNLSLSQELMWNPPGWHAPAQEFVANGSADSIEVVVSVTQLSGTDDDFVKAHRKGKPTHGHP